MEAATLQEMHLILFLKNTAHRARFRGNLVKLSNIPYATYGTPEIRTFIVWVLYMEVGRAYMIAKGRGIAS